MKNVLSLVFQDIPSMQTWKNRFSSLYEVLLSLWPVDLDVKSFCICIYIRIKRGSAIFIAYKLAV